MPLGRPGGVLGGSNWMKLMLRTHFSCSRWPEMGQNGRLRPSSDQVKIISAADPNSSLWYNTHSHSLLHSLINSLLKSVINSSVVSFRNSSLAKAMSPHGETAIRSNGLMLSITVCFQASYCTHSRPTVYTFRPHTVYIQASKSMLYAFKSHSVNFQASSCILSGLIA